MKAKISYIALISLFLTNAACTAERMPTDEEELNLIENVPQDLSIHILENGKPISYKEYGNKEGTPVFYFHGFPGSHKDVELFIKDEILDDLNIRLIAVNRQGYSHSAVQEGRLLIQWPQVIKELTAYLMIDQFSILAYSGGAPFAYACSKEIPDKIKNIVVVSGMTTYDAPGAKKGSAMIIPKAPGLILKGMSKQLETKPQKLEANMRKGFPVVDQIVFDQSGLSQIMISTINEGMKYGTSGAYQDAKIYKLDWGFDLNEVKSPIVLYHGELDQNVRIESASFIIESLPDCTSYVLQDEGHLSLIYNHINDILKNFQ